MTAMEAVYEVLDNSSLGSDSISVKVVFRRNLESI